MKSYEEVYKKWLKPVIVFLIHQWFFIFLAAFIALAHSYPEFAKLGGTIRAQYSIGYGAVAVIFLISGLTMSSRNLWKNALHWRAHFTVLSLSFLITSLIIYGIALGIRRANNHNIDEWMLVGMIVTFACPTTVSSNVVMTKKAKGNDILTLCEVFIGNILGAFITPALVQMYMTGVWDFGNPKHQAVQITTLDLYRDVMKQLGLSVFVPVFVGQVVQNLFPKQTAWTASHLYLGKVGSVMLLLIMFQSFSTAFGQNAFNEVSHALIIFLVFFNIGIYLFFTALSYLYARPWLVIHFLRDEPTAESSKTYRICYKIFRPFYYSKHDAVAIMLCGPAKTAALGVSLMTSQYGADNPKLGILLVPLVLFQAEQVATAQVLTKFMKDWVLYEERIKAKHEKEVEAERERQIMANEHDPNLGSSKDTESTRLSERTGTSGTANDAINEINNRV